MSVMSLCRLKKKKNLSLGNSRIKRVRGRIAIAVKLVVLEYRRLHKKA